MRIKVIKVIKVTRDTGVNENMLVQFEDNCVNLKGF